MLGEISAQTKISSALGGAGDLVSKVISTVIIGVTPFRVLITLLITYLLSPLPLPSMLQQKQYPSPDTLDPKPPSEAPRRFERKGSAPRPTF